MSQSNGSPIEAYRNALLVRLINFFPNLATNEEFIELRSRLASSEFQKIILEEGSTFNDADSAAYEILYQGLVFSPYSTIKSVLVNNFEDIVSAENISSKAKELLSSCQEIFQKYPTTDDYFESSVEYETELIPELIKFIEKKL